MPDGAKLPPDLKAVRAKHRAAMHRQSARPTRKRTLAIQVLAKTEREIHDRIKREAKEKLAAGKGGDDGGS